MKQFIQFLSEGRSHPELNPRESPLEQLKKYKDKENIFITFVKKEKVGINPKSDFNTPLGIYTYPLKDSWDIYNVEEKGIRYSFPYAASFCRWIYVLELKSKEGIVDMSSYSESDFNRDMNKLHKLYKLDDINIEKMKSDAKKQVPIMWFWNITRMITSVYADKFGMKGKSTTFNWNYLLRKLGYKGFIDTKGMGYIHYKEPLQAVFLDITPFKVIDKIENKPEARRKVWNDVVTVYTKDWNEIAYKLDWIYGIFNGGTWKYGNWKDGVWKDGTWKQGTWENGKWEKGRIYSWKFGGVQVNSKVNPNKFYELEKKSNTLDELKRKLALESK